MIKDAAVHLLHCTQALDSGNSGQHRYQAVAPRHGASDKKQGPLTGSAAEETHAIVQADRLMRIGMARLRAADLAQPIHCG